MKIRSIRRITNDSRHNAFTGCCWFKGNLYVAFRQGDSHVCELGRIVVLRSRDGGASWDNVAVIRGPADTRDAHLYTDGKRLYAVGFCYAKKAGKEILGSGCASSADGDVWTGWKAYEGTGTAVMWRPQFFRGKHYCAGYLFEMELRGKKQSPEVNWYESADGHRWRKVRTLHSGDEKPNECYLEILDDGTATMLMRCEGGAKHPYLCRSKAPFRSWTKTRLTDISIGGPCVWTVDGEVYIGVRWLKNAAKNKFKGAQTAIFRIVKNKTELEFVLPSGGGSDHSYMGVARHPENKFRFAFSFYSDAIAPTDPAVNQWYHPDIYLADIVFAAEFLTDNFKVSKRLELPRGLTDAKSPDPSDLSLGFKKIQCDPKSSDSNFLNVSGATESKPGVVYIVRDIEVGPIDSVRVHLGYDGPVKVWWNDKEVFAGPGTNPAIEDRTTLSLQSRHGKNRLAIALDTNGGKAEGVFVRWERA